MTTPTSAPRDPYPDAVAFLNERISYLQGGARPGRAPGPADLQAAFVPATRCEFDVLGVGRELKEPPPPPTSPQDWRSPFDDVLAGAYTYRIPVSFRISASWPRGLTVSLGTWSRDADDQQLVVRRSEVLLGLVRTLYPVVDATPVGPARPATGADTSVGGLVLGQPMAKAPVPGDNTMPIDRVVRALGGRSWSATVLASPEPPELPRRLRESLVAELRFAQGAQRAAGYELPVAKQFTDLVGPTLDALLEATAMGAWRTAVYLQADPAVYPILASVWRSVFAGERPAPEAVSVLDLGAQVNELAGAWAFTRGPQPTANGRYQHPFEYQTLLNCAQLAAYVHLPSLEVAGFRVDLAPRFDAEVGRRDATERRVELGTVVSSTARPAEPDGRPAADSDDGPPFTVSVPSLAGHVFIAGITGSGKTTTCLHLLRAMNAVDVPFLVIEPSKLEYRVLADPGGDPAAPRLAVFGVGLGEGTPLRLNPFEVEVGTSIAEHVDLLRVVFTASFGDMWTPLPQVLDRCLRRVYEQRGWDLASDRNSRLASGDDRALAFPTLRELSASVDPVVDELGFDPEARDRVRGSLATRIDGLRGGTKGVLLDTRASLSMASFLQRPTVLELERLADESDKAFLMGLLVIRLVEFRRAERRSGRVGDGELRHLLVIEEAHRLLANVVSTAGVDNTARAAAVESFSNLLAEIRAYGQGIVVLDQVPTKLAPDVIKNTNLKIAHRVVDEADRTVLAGSMAMTDPQKAALATLPRGQAAVFGDGDDAPLRIRIRRPSAPASTPSTSPGPVVVARAAASHPGCVCVDVAEGTTECGTAERLVEQDEVRQTIVRVATSALNAGSTTELSSGDLAAAVRRDLAPGEREHLVIGCLSGRGAEWLADLWGSRWRWSFGLTSRYAEVLRSLLVTSAGLAAGVTDGAAAAALADYQQVATPLHARTVDPYPGCTSICTAELSGRCLYRHAAAYTLERADVQQAWNEARAGDTSPDADGYAQTWVAAVDTIAPEIVGPSTRPGYLRAAALCFAQQAVAAEVPTWPPWLREQFVADLLEVSAAVPEVDGVLGDMVTVEPVAELAPSEQAD